MAKDNSILSAIMRERATMTASQARLADYILSHPLHAATMGIEDLAGKADVSIATLNRFVRKLGLSGYAQFRSRAVETLHSTLAPIEKLKGREGRPTELHAVLLASLDDAMENLRHCAKAASAEAIERAAAQIPEARNVVVLGLGICAPLARLLGELILPFCRNLNVLDGWGGTERTTRATMGLGEGDLAICLTLPRYSKTTVELARMLREQGADVLAITDSLNSPVIPFAKTVLLAPAQHDVLHASVTGVTAMAEGLAACLTARRGTVDDAVELATRIYPYLFEQPADGAALRNGGARSRSRTNGKEMPAPPARRMDDRRAVRGGLPFPTSQQGEDE